MLNDGRTRALEVRGHQPVYCSTVRRADPTWRGAVVTPTDSGTFSPIPSFGQPREKSVAARWCRFGRIDLILDI